MAQIKYFIHGNGQDSTCSPNGFTAHDMPGHGQEKHDPSLYSMEKLIQFYALRIPRGAQVLGHSLGGHIALNVALLRRDISVVACGMSPIEGLHEIGPVMTPVAEFAGFQNPQRSDADIMAFIEALHEKNEDITKLLFKAAKKQDPNFNSVLFSTGIQAYDWSERTKALGLQDRIKFVISHNEKCYNAKFLLASNINSVMDNYVNHTPWLFNPSWFDEISSLEQRDEDIKSISLDQKI